MRKSSRSFIEFLVILGAGVVLIVAYGIVQATQEGSPNDHATGRPEATPTQTTIITPTASPASPTATVTAPPTTTVTVGPDALLQTAEQATEWGFEYARGLGADSPRLVKVELMPLGDAMALTKLVPDEVPDVDDLGWDMDDAAWRVQFDGDEFFHESCEPPVDDPDDTGPHSCPTSETAIFIFQASDGLAITIALGYPVPQ